MADAGEALPLPTTQSPRRHRPGIAAIASAVPTTVSQAALWEDHYARLSGNDIAVRRLWHGAGVQTRHLAADPLAEDVSGWGTGARMNRFFAEAVPLAKQSVLEALAAARVDPSEVGMLAVVSCTGYGNPGLDVRLATDLDMSADLRRLSIGHMGCYAAVPGLATVADYVASHHRPGLLLCAELTSLHVQRPPHDREQLVAHALFADACAAAVIVPGATAARAADPPRPATPGFLDVLEVMTVTDTAAAGEMTWDITDTGFRMGLSAAVPAAVARHVAGLVDRLLAGHGLSRDDVAQWAVHPGGPRIVDVVQDQLALTDGQVEASRGVLAEYGNCSSSTVLLVMNRLRPAPGQYVVALAFGPGLTIAGALLQASPAEVEAPARTA